jgi:hypothetical protein
MARAIIGTDPREIADGKMDRAMEKSARANGGQIKLAPGITEQIKTLYPDTWKEVIAEMRYEYANPDYVERKERARKRIDDSYFAVVPAYERGRITAEDYRKKHLAQWVIDNIGFVK